MEGYKKTHSVKPAAYVVNDGKLLTVTSPYNTEFVAQLKANTKTRRWNPEKKAWTVDVKEQQKLLEIAGQFYTIVEDEAAADPRPKAIPSKSSAPGRTDPGTKPEDEIDIWTDGACSSNPGPGGYGIVFRSRGKTWEKTGGFRLTTNNRMELMGVIAALESLPANCTVTLYSDSQYLVNSIAKGWAEGWQARGWIKKGGQAVPNADLWKRLLELYSRHNVDIRWIKGHNGSAENERCDEMAVAEAAKRNLPEDKGYKPV